MIMNNRSTVLSIAAAVAVAVLTSACTANSICAKRKECNEDLEDDSVGVCIEEFNTGINALRANKEEVCHILADAQLALSACAASLDCDDFEEADLGGKCDDERDNFEDAIEDAADGDCSSFD